MRSSHVELKGDSAARRWTPNHPRRKSRAEHTGSLTLPISSRAVKFIRGPISALAEEQWTDTGPHPARLCSSPQAPASGARTLRLALPQLLHARQRRMRTESHPERVKKEGCCQDQSEVSCHRGGRASHRAAWRAEGAPILDSSPVIL